MLQEHIRTVVDFFVCACDFRSTRCISFKHDCKIGFLSDKFIFFFPQAQYWCGLSLLVMEETTSGVQSFAAGDPVYFPEDVGVSHL